MRKFNLWRNYMTIQPIANQTVAPSNLPEVLKQLPHVFENICANFDPQTMKDFLSTCKTVRQISSEFKADYPKTYSKLLDQIFPHRFCKKSIKELSDEMIELCEKTNQLQLDNFRRRDQGRLSDGEIAKYQKLQFLELKHLLNSLHVSGKFNKIDKEKLERAFTSACMYSHPEMVDLFIRSGRYHDISIQCLNRAFGQWAADDGTTIQTLIDSDRFHEISKESLGDALDHASINGHPGVVQAIMESERAHEIPLKTFSESLEWAARNGELKKGTHLKTLCMLMRFPQFNKVSPEKLGDALVKAARSWRGDSIRELVQSSRFHEISTERLNETFGLILDRINSVGTHGLSSIDAAKAIIQSNRFHEIRPQLQNICNSKPELKETLATVCSV